MFCNYNPIFYKFKRDYAKIRTKRGFKGQKEVFILKGFNW